MVIQRVGKSKAAGDWWNTKGPMEQPTDPLRDLSSGLHCPYFLLVKPPFVLVNQA